MRNDAARGWKKVFGFTFTQYVRTKSFIVGTIIVCLITILLVGGLNIICLLYTSPSPRDS